MYKNKPLKFIHTHFLDPRFNDFNNLLLNHINIAKLYKILLIIFRVIKDKWIIKLPKQPIQGLGNHKNDSFRELIILLKKNNIDVDVELVNYSIHCWIYPNILLYDRPTLEWCNNDIIKSSLFLLGNGNINNEGNQIKSIVSNVKPWIFWPRRPMILEKILNEKGILNYDNRNIESIFIGNYENNVQEKYRNNNKNWKSVLTEYHLTKGNNHIFKNNEYLMKLRNSKYGLCLRGYGSKCHREVELMAFGTVPLVTEDVSMDSYMDPPLENIHYLTVSNPEDIPKVINSVDIDKWLSMSNACHEWYMKNIHSSNCWKNMIENILYNSF